MYNAEEESLSLEGWSLSDDFDNPTKWTFPNIGIEQNEYLLIWASDKDRKEISTPRTLINWRDNWKYLIPSSNPGSSWINLNFNDSEWKEGKSGFGYGDGDDETQIPTGTRSVLIRKEFNISNVELIQKLILDIDFDDGFVAFLNGEEIARANMNGNQPSYNSFASTYSEAKIKEGQKPDRFDISPYIRNLKSGKNVLAIQAHNHSDGSSDFTIIPFLSALYSVSTDEGVNPPSLLDLERSLLHTNFRLSSTQESIYLFNENEMLVDSINVMGLAPDVSYGSISDEKFAFFDKPTPGSANASEYFEGIVDQEIIFSKEGGKVDPFNLTLSGVDAPYEIRFTHDAAEPTKSSRIYQDEGIQIRENQIIRARVFRENYIPSRIQSQFYLTNDEHDLPVISLITEPSNLFDFNEGIYVSGPNATSALPFFGSNFWEDWERPVHVSLFEKDENQKLSFDAGVKIFGGWSRANAQKSLSIFARGSYGTSEIDYPLFPDLPYDKFQAFVLRNSGNDWLNTNMRDATLTGIMKGSDLEIQAYRPFASYLNGDYWGIYNMREKVNEHFLASKHNIDINTVDIIELQGDIIHGDNQEYLDLLDFIELNDLSVSDNYEYIKTQIDVENYILYNVAQLYFNNTDWPGNNIKFWKAQGGKWRWILFDTDFGFGIWNPQDYFNNTINFALNPNGPEWPNPPWSTFLFRNMMSNLEFRNEFINRYADEINTRFLASNVIKQINENATRIAPEIIRHFERWTGNTQEWSNRIQSLRNFASNRPSQVKNHIKSTFRLPDFHRIKVNIDDVQKGFVQLNSLKLEAKEWSGDYFESVPIKLTAVAKLGYEFSHWEGAINSTEIEISLDLKRDENITAVFNKSSTPIANVIINEINYKSPDDFDTGDWIELYNSGDLDADISSWIIKDDDDAHGFDIPENTILKAEDYLVITRNIEDFSSLHTVVTNVIGDIDFGLSSNADAVRVFDADSTLIDEVFYTSESPWPTEANGEGFTLELKEPSLDNSLAENWAPVHQYGSPGVTNLIDSATSEISDINEMKIFSNPTKGNFTLQLELEKTLDLNISIFDVKGRMVKHLTHSTFLSGSKELNYDITELTSGMYYLKILNKSGQSNVLKINKI